MTVKTRRVRYLLDRDGRFFARRAVPLELRLTVGARELLEPLGADRRVALQRLHASCARFEEILGAARQGRPPEPPAVQFSQAVHDCYHREIERLKREELGGDLCEAGPDSMFGKARLRALQKVAFGLTGKLGWTEADRTRRQEYLGALRTSLTNDPAYDEALVGFVDAEIDAHVTFLDATVGWAMAEAADGRSLPPRGSKEWLELAQGLARALVEAIHFKRRAFDGQPSYDVLRKPPGQYQQTDSEVSIASLCEAYIADLERAGRGAEMGKKCRLAVRSLTEFLTSQQAMRVTRSDLRLWLQHLTATLSGKTIRDSYLAAVNAIFAHAFDHGLLPANPAQGLKFKISPKPQNRDKGYTRAEAERILKLASEYKPRECDRPASREHPTLIAAKRWVPFLCAYTGARVAEITQLRRCDIQNAQDISFIRITPEAGSVKTQKYRDVPLHHYLVAEGFLQFVESAPDGPLFFSQVRSRTGRTHPSKFVAGRISQWLRASGLTPNEVAPSHGWRHSFKTFALEVGIQTRIIDAIQGHAPRSAGEMYGDVSLRTKATAIERFPTFSIGHA